MKKLLILTLFFFTLTSYSQTVVVCNGNYAYSWHSTPNCRGLSNCQGGLYNVDLSYAVYTMNRRGCCICTNDPNCLTDRTDPAYVPSPVPFQPDWQFLENMQYQLTEQAYKKGSDLKIEILINQDYCNYITSNIGFLSFYEKKEATRLINEWNEGLIKLNKTPIGTLLEDKNYNAWMNYVKSNQNTLGRYVSLINKKKN